MNSDYYEAGRSYNKPLDPEKYDTRSEKEKNGGNKVSPSTEIFKKVVVTIANKSVDQIDSHEVTAFIDHLKGRRTGQTGDPDRKEINTAIQKVREREFIALDKSHLPSSKSKHQDNISFLEDVMRVNNIVGIVKKEELPEILRIYKSICKGISKKTINNITREDVESFLKISLVRHTLGYNEPLKGKDLDYEKAALIKVLEREKVALRDSTFESSKERHASNIRLFGDNLDYLGR
jgi:hypothetical protein